MNWFLPLNSYSEQTVWYGPFVSTHLFWSIFIVRRWNPSDLCTVTLKLIGQVIYLCSVFDIQFFFEKLVISCQRCGSGFQFGINRIWSGSRGQKIVVQHENFLWNRNFCSRVPILGDSTMCTFFEFKMTY